MMTDDLDEEFRQITAQIVPSLIHHLAFHPHQMPLIFGMSAELGAQMTTPARSEHVCWTIAREVCSLPGLRRVKAATVMVPGSPPVSVDIDNVSPVHRALTRFVQCAVNDDRETGSAVFATIPDDEIETFGRMLLWNITRFIRAHQPNGCRL
jgi:hypothetical protein